MKDRRPPSEQWRYYDRQSRIAKQRALRSLLILDEVDSLMVAGMTLSSAVKAIAATKAAGAASIWSWLSKVSGVSPQDRLAYLIPEFRGGGRPAELDAELFRAIATDYLRVEQPSWAECVRRLKALAEKRGNKLPHARTLWRRLRREYDRPTIAIMRGERLPDWLRARLPVNDR